MKLLWTVEKLHAFDFPNTPEYCKRNCDIVKIAVNLGDVDVDD